MTDTNLPDRRKWMHSVLDRYEGPLTRYATRLVGDADCARDVVQETFLRFCSDGAPQDDGHVGPWLFTTCRNRALDVLRKEKPMQPLSEVATSNDKDTSPPPSAAMERSETVSRLQAVMASLPDNQQEAIRLRFQNDLSYEEIGTVMQTSVGNVGYLLHHAIKTVREQLGIRLPSAAPNRRSSS